ncbi:Acid-sensing ion channel 4-A [Holothuria leucospilota]|uniref:Acid-sensing ion channel 4-A n=1 Tax=Holothuria leucospilota TaxID=206669 RepID=A0A9Q1H480_HOLLE|nr:Acid-sensing ion channel 4-A [Holothuria leucospilota]
MSCRSLWLLALLMIYFGLGFGLIQSLRKFFLFPVSTLMIINHAEEIVFPAVTICNHNIMRSDYYPNNPNFTQVRALSSGDDTDFDWAWYDRFLADDGWNLTETVILGGHHLEDMILECKWQSYENCSAANFTTTLTDFGVCYTFNGNIDKPRTVSSPGSSYGLRLRIDIQQELYSFSEFSGAGLKVLVHPSNELPLVKMQGFSVPPGFQTEISMKYIEITNLPHPYKPYCNDIPLKYSGVYTADLCRYECEVDRIIKECGCKEYRHPGLYCYSVSFKLF